MLDFYNIGSSANGSVKWQLYLTISVYVAKLIGVYNDIDLSLSNKWDLSLLCTPICQVNELMAATTMWLEIVNYTNTDHSHIHFVLSYCKIMR